VPSPALLRRLALALPLPAKLVAVREGRVGKAKVGAPVAVAVMAPKG